MFTNEKTPAMPSTFGVESFSTPSEQGDYGEVDQESYERQLALLEHNEQAAKRRAYENEYWRQRTLARQFQSQACAQPSSGLKTPTFDDYSLEAMDTKHRVGELLNIFMDEYNKLKPSRLFFDWLSSMTPRTQARMINKVMEDRGCVGESVQ